MKYTDYATDWYYSRKYENYAKNMKRCIFSLVGILILLIISMFLCGCKSIQYVPVEKVVTEYKTNTVHDSVYLQILKHDSVVVEKQGDTVFVNRWHTLYKDKLKEVIRTDTFIKVDSVQIPYPVEKKLTKWQQVKIDAGGMAIGGCIVILLIIIVGFIVRAFRKT